MYRETQRFRQLWLLVLIIVSTAVPLIIIAVGLYQQLVIGKPFGNNPVSDTGLIVLSGFMFLLLVGVLLLFLTSTLYTTIDSEGIRYKLTPFHRKYRQILWSEIEKAEVIRYNPIGDYGGWGLRAGKKGKAFNVSGNTGLMLNMKSGKNILIGTNKEQELKTFLKNRNSSQGNE